MASSVADWSLLIGVLLLTGALLGGIFHFIRLGLYLAEINKVPSAIISGAHIIGTIIYVVR